MINKVSKPIIIFFFSLLLCFLSYKFCYFIAENFFFDKFFYQKSISHGYRQYDKLVPLSSFGERSIDLNLLENNNSYVDKNTSQYKILIVGDSYLWGQGLRNSQRYASILQLKLNKIKNVEIISLGMGGWNILDYLNTYQKIIKSYSPNLTIFSLVNNDIFINKSDSDNEIVKNCLAQYPKLSVTYEFDPSLFNNKETSIPNNERQYYKTTLDAWNNPINLCILNKSLEKLPTNNTIYFIPDNYLSIEEFYIKYKEQLSILHKNIITSERGQYIPKYHKFWKDTPWNHFLISPGESHPNALANRMYADILFNEITTNPKWNFNK